MKITGIIAENHPFHKGLRKIIENTHELTECDVLVAVMPGCFSQRGEPYAIDKWQRTQQLLEMGVDLVIEIPFALAVQSKKYFAKASIELLALAGVDTLAFASEINNLAELQELAALPFGVDAIKERLIDGAYPQTYDLEAGAYFHNDILAIAYLRSMREKSMTPLSFQHVFDEFEEEIQFSKGIRWQQYYPFLRWKLLTQDQVSLANLFLFDEVMLHHLVSQAEVCDTWEIFLKSCMTRRYTQARIQRACTQILVNLQKSEVEKAQSCTTLRILGFNDMGRGYLKLLNANNVKIASRFSRVPQFVRALEYRATITYVTPFTSERRNEILKRELGGPIIKTKDGSQ